MEKIILELDLEATKENLDELFSAVCWAHNSFAETATKREIYTTMTLLEAIFKLSLKKNLK